MRLPLLTMLFFFAMPLGATTLIGSLPQPATNPTAILLADGRVLIAGGYSNESLDSAAIYDPAAHTLMPISPMNSGHTAPSSILLRDGRVMINGGSGADAVEIYDPASGQFAPDSPQGSPHENAPLVMLSDGRVLLAGGTDTMANPTSVAEIFDPATNTWSSDGNLAEAREAQAAVLLSDGRVLMVGGVAPPAGNPDSEIFDPIAKTSMVLPGTAFSQAIAERLADGRVVIINTVTVSVFDPSTQKFSVIEYDLPTSGQAVVMLHDGRFLLAGGSDSVTGAVSPAVYVFDPTDSSLVRADTLQVARNQAAAVVLRDGSVLVAGGYNGTAAQAMVDLYAGTPRRRAAPRQ